MKKLCLLLVLLLLVALPMTAYNSEKSVLRIGITDEPTTVSPFACRMLAWTNLIYHNVYDDLIEYDDNLNRVGGLAEDWSVSEDGLVWTFNLRKGVKWSDGEDFNADDVVFTYNAYIGGDYSQQEQVKTITKCEKVDDYTVKIYTEVPLPDMVYVLIGIVPEHIYGDKSLEDLYTFQEDTPVGTGPFKLVEWKKGQFLKFEANKNCFKGAPHIDELVYVVFANTDTLTQALIKGEIDAVGSVTRSQIKMLEQEPNIKIVKAEGRHLTQLGFNCWDSPESKGNPLLLDSKIRLACDYAINKEQLVEIALYGLGTPGTSLIPPAMGDWHWEPGDEKHNYDPEKAKQILEEAGYVDTDGDGIREDSEGNLLDFRFAVISSEGSDTYFKDALIIQKNLQNIGINTTITTMDTGAQSDLIYRQNFNTDMYIWGWGSSGNPLFLLSVVLTEQINKRSDCFWSNKEYDELYKIQASQIDREKRLETVYEMQRIVYEEAPYIVLYNETQAGAYRTDKFEGWTRVPEGTGNSVFQVNSSSLLNVRPK